MNENNDFRPLSPDAMFARIMERLDDLKADNKDLRTEQGTIAERVTAMERDKWFQRGIVAAISVIAAGMWSWLTGGSGK